MTSIKGIRCILYILISLALLSCKREYPIHDNIQHICKYTRIQCDTLNYLPYAFNIEGGKRIYIYTTIDGVVCEDDKEIESQIEGTPVKSCFTDYSTEIIKNISITASKPIFGKNSGEELNSYFVIRPFGDVYISDKKKLGILKEIFSEKEIILIEDYLSLSPLLMEGFELFSLPTINEYYENEKLKEEIRLTFKTTLDDDNILVYNSKLTSIELR